MRLGGSGRDQGAVMSQAPTPKKAGRPTLPPEQRRTGRLGMRTYPDIEAKAKRIGTKAVEALIRGAKNPFTPLDALCKEIEAEPAVAQQMARTRREMAMTELLTDSEGGEL